jgi:guanine deaminase
MNTVSSKQTPAASFQLGGPRAWWIWALSVAFVIYLFSVQTGYSIVNPEVKKSASLFRVFDAKNPQRPVRVGLGTDVGAGTSFSQLQSLNEAYKVAQMNQTKLNAIQAFYLATRGGAEALYLQDRIGTVAKGYEADLVILDRRATPLMSFRSGYCKDIVEQLFVLMTLGDDRAIKATYVAGEQVYERSPSGDGFRYPLAA